LRGSASVRYLRTMPLSPALARGVLATAFCLAPLGCKAKAKPAPIPAQASASASAAPLPAPAERCRTIGNGPSLSVGDRARSPDTSDDEPDAAADEDLEAALPFATRVDSALALGNEFAAGGLTTHAGRTEAFVALVPFDGKPGRRVGLGIVHGDVDPPLVASRGAGVLAAVADMDAGGGMLRLSELEHDAEKARGELSVTGVEHDAGASIAAGDGGALLVFGARSKRGVTLKAQLIEPERGRSYRAPRPPHRPCSRPGPGDTGSPGARRRGSATPGRRLLRCHGTAGRTISRDRSSRRGRAC
jgi:hypothetical protein